MTTYSIFVLKDNVVEEYIQRLDLKSLIYNLPENLVPFEPRILVAAHSGAGYYGLGYVGGCEVHMIVVEYRAISDWIKLLVIGMIIGYLIATYFYRH